MALPPKRYQVADISDEATTFNNSARGVFGFIVQGGRIIEFDIHTRKMYKLIQALMGLNGAIAATSISTQDEMFIREIDLVNPRRLIGFDVIQIAGTDKMSMQIVTDGEIRNILLNRDESVQLAMKLQNQSPDFRCDELEDGSKAVHVYAATSINPKIAKSPTALVSMPDRFMHIIGSIIVNWGQFEIAFNNTLATFVRSGSSPGDIPPPSNFKKKNDRLRKEIKSTFSGNENIIRKLCGVLNMAGDLCVKRNIIAHGSIQAEAHVQVLANGSTYVEVKVVATGRNATLKWGFKELEKFYYDVAHLTALMQNISSAETNSVGLKSEEACLLREFFDLNNHIYL